MRMSRTRLSLAVASSIGVALIAAGGVAFSQGASSEGAEIGPYTGPHMGVIVDAGVTGNARTFTLARKSIVFVQAAGLAPRSEFAVHVHLGSCLAFGPHFRFDPLGPGTRSNEVWLDLKANRIGLAFDRVNVRPLPADQTYSVVIHALSNPDHAPGESGHPGARIACGDLQADD